MNIQGVNDTTRLMALVGMLVSPVLYAETDWLSVTVDNDMFVGNDSGYTNGLFVSWFDTEENKNQPAPSIFVRPLLWSLSEQKIEGAVNAFTIGQTMMTPQDITIENPTDDDLPYAGLLMFNNTYLAINEHYADKISTTLGLVGPSSGAKATQKWVHKLIDADDPKGWDTQLKDELVFQFTRGRIRRSWVSESGHIDLLTSGEASLGTLSSSVSGGVMVRYGRDLIRSYATPLFGSSRTSNPVAIEGGWYLYAGLNVGYIFNQIFADGNTFRDSRSIDYEHTQISMSAGMAYSWQDLSITLVINDSNLIENDKEQLQELTRYGTLTIAWRY